MLTYSIMENCEMSNLGLELGNKTKGNVNSEGGLGEGE